MSQNVMCNLGYKVTVDSYTRCTAKDITCGLIYSRP